MRFQHTLVDFANLDGMAEDTAESEAFAEKFKPKKTTDDVYTPQAVYDAVAKWVFETYGLPEDTVVVRPFYPGGNFLTHDYPEGCIVLDNPPFSIMHRIIRFYVANKVRFFLFASTLTLFQQIDLCNAVVVGGDVTFENGAKINVSFLTSLGSNRVEIAGDLHDLMRDADRGRPKKYKRGYEFPPNATTAARLATISGAGLSMSIEEAWPLDRLEPEHHIFGGGILIADADAQRVAAQREAAQREAAQREAAQREAAQREAALRARTKLHLADKDAHRLAALNMAREIERRRRA